MKDVREIKTGNDHVGLEFTAKKGDAGIYFDGDEFYATAPGLGGGGVEIHNELTGREAVDAHPYGALSLGTEIKVQGVTVGNWSDGDTIPEGTSLQSLFDTMFTKQIPPTYVAPTVRLDGTTYQTKEYGEDLNYSLTSTFFKNDAGDLVTATYFEESTQLCQYSDTTTPCTGTKRIDSPGTTTDYARVNYHVTVHHLEGPIKDDNLGHPYEPGHILEGDVSSPNEYNTWQYPRFYGPGEPTDSASLRTLTKSFSNSFTLHTGGSAEGNLKFTVAVPPSKKISSIIDIDANNADLTGNYVANGTIDLVPISGGNNMTFKLYTLTIVSPYSSDHRHNVTLANI